MKKKLLLAIAIVAILVCLFAIGASAESKIVKLDYDPGLDCDSSLVSILDGDYLPYTPNTWDRAVDGTVDGVAYDTESLCVLTDGAGGYYVFPSWYIYYDNRTHGGSGNDNSFKHRLEFTSLNAAISKYNTNNETDYYASFSRNGNNITSLVRLEMLEGTQQIAQDTQKFENSPNLKEVRMSSTLSSIGAQNVFSGSTVEIVDMSKSKVKSWANNFASGAKYLEKITLPSTLTSIAYGSFNGCSALSMVNSDDEGVIDLSGCTSIGQHAFYQCTSIKNVKFGENLTEINAEAFRDCSSLVFVDFGDGDNALTFKAHRTFYNCDALKAVSLPKNTTYMGNGTFATCGALGAVYLGESLQYLAGNKGDSAGDGPCFADNPNMYFVQKPFDVIKADGTFYSADEFVQPEKPDIYYFPSTLQAIVATGNPNNYFRLYDFTYTYTTTTVTDESTGKTKTVYVLNVDENGYPVMSYGNYNIPNINANALVTDKDGNAIINEYLYLFEYERDENGDLILTEVTESGKYYMRATIKRDADGNIVYRLDENGERIKLYDDKGVAIKGMYDDGMTSDFGSADRAIVNCTNLNSVLVFPEGFTGVYDGTKSRDENQRGDSLGTGMITKCATADNPITLVFLGRIDRVSMDRRNGGTSYMTYMFANPANTGFENTQVATYYTANNKYYSNQNEMYVIFCHAEGGAQKYKINFAGSADNAYYPVLNATIQTAQEGSNWHIYEPGTDYTSEATCELPAGAFKLCFCGKVCYSDVVEGSAPLGHDKTNVDITVYYPLLNGAPNYFADAHNVYTCARCSEEQDEEAKGTALFVGDRGYSYEENGSAILYRLHVNVDAIKAYSEAFKYGIVVSAAPSGAPVVLENGAIKEMAQTLVFEMQGTDFSYIQAKITNIGATQELNCQAYAIDGTTVTYIGHNTVNAMAEIVTYDAIVTNYGKKDDTQA